ncbi:MAG: ubiquinone/menaquinone biosynthesis methyltransferase [Deltaproteobacteria bacterium]|nr:ubiquinone/menaquinone biosynthesis methyltransferase [Deltaproteobacteria bacterium]
MSKEIQKMFSSIADTYDAANRILSFRTDVRWRQLAVEACLKKNPTSILDLCAGTLDLSVALYEQAPYLSIVACDFSLPMLREGLHKTTAKNIQITCGDGHSLPFQSESFDVIVCGFGIRNLELREQALQEIRKVLKQRGSFVILEFFKPNTGLSKLFYQTYGKYILPTLGGLISKNPDAYRYLFRSIQQFVTLEEYEALLQKHHFSLRSSKPLSGGIAHLLEAEAV